MLGTLPVGTASQDAEQVVSLFFRFGSGKLFVGAVVSAASKLRDNLAPMNDLSNGSHLSDESATLATRCEKRTTPGLKTDFLFVIIDYGSALLLTIPQRGLAFASCDISKRDARKRCFQGALSRVSSSGAFPIESPQ